MRPNHEHKLDFYSALRGLVVCGLITSVPLAQAAMDEKTANSPDIDEVVEETEEAMDALAGYSAAQRDKALRESREALQELDTRLEVFEARIDRNWDTLSSEARVSAREVAQTLREERIELAEQYGSMKSSSDAAWDEIKSGFVAAFEELDKAWQEAEAEFATEGERQANAQ